MGKEVIQLISLNISCSNEDQGEVTYKRILTMHTAQMLLHSMLGAMKANIDTVLIVCTCRTYLPSRSCGMLSTE